MVTTDPWIRSPRSADGEVDIERDRDLVKRAQAGDRSAFDALYACYFGRLERYCMRRVNDPHEAQDLAQDVFLRAWRALPTFTGERRFYPWLSVIASNLCTDSLRRKQRFGPIPVAEPREDEISTGYSTEESVVADAEIAIATEAFSHLSQRHRRVLYLRERSGLSYQDIADQEGIRVTTVETLIWRARQAFKREFSALSGTEGRLAGFAGAAAFLFRMRTLRKAARAASTVSSRLSAIGPQGIAIALGGAVSTAAIVVAASAGAAHPVHTALRGEHISALANPSAVAHAQGSNDSDRSASESAGARGSGAVAGSGATSAVAHNITSSSRSGASGAGSGGVSVQGGVQVSLNGTGVNTPTTLNVPVPPIVQNAGQTIATTIGNVLSSAAGAIQNLTGGVGKLANTAIGDASQVVGSAEQTVGAATTDLQNKVGQTLQDVPGGLGSGLGNATSGATALLGGGPSGTVPSGTAPSGGETSSAPPATSSGLVKQLLHGLGG
jgi:RNA polymerase sigma-70 factor (ECF subfamily)